MKRVLIWGLGREFDKYIARIKRFEELGQILIVGVTSNDFCYKKVYGRDFIKKEEVKNYIDYDVILATGDFVNDINYQSGGTQI